MNEKIYNEIKKLAAANKAADSKEKRNEIAMAMEELRNKYPEECAEALEMLIQETSQKIEELTIRERMGEVAKVVSMSYIANKYFGKSRSWLAHKMNGDRVNGKTAAFSPEEMDKLKFAFADISQMIGSFGAAL